MSTTDEFRMPHTHRWGKELGNYTCAYCSAEVSRSRLFAAAQDRKVSFLDLESIGGIVLEKFVQKVYEDGGGQ